MIKESRRVGEETINEISQRIRENSEKITFGTVSVSLRFHEGKCVSISHETVEQTKHKERIYDNNK